MTRIALLGLGAAVLMSTAGCTNDAETGSAKELARTMGGAKADGTDLCELHGWYGDGVCDDFCPASDADCACTDCTECVDADLDGVCDVPCLDEDADGRCDVSGGAVCEPADVDCLSLPPECEPGYVPEVVGGCWGACIPESDCASSTTCADEDLDGVCDDACIDRDLDGVCDGPAGVLCDEAAVDCLSLPPACGAGEVPSVVAGCWGDCVPAVWCSDDEPVDEPGADCDASRVDCAVVPPTCPSGEVPSVEDGCWGPCVAASTCR